MAMITDAPRVTPRVSTPAPFDIPRWDTPPDIPVPDFSSLIVPGRWEEPAPPVEMPRLSLADLSLTANNPMTLGSLSMNTSPAVTDWATAFAPKPKYIPAQLTEAKAAAKAAKQAAGTLGGGARSGNWGLGAYGVTGKSGMSNQRGSAAFGLQPPMWKALQAANGAMKAAGLGTFGITDGFRSYAAQVDVKRRKGNLAATPGRSVHGIGLAADLRLSGKQQAWMEKNGAKYGLARLPSESWHWQLLPSLWKG